MAQRYVRVQAANGQLHYGLLQADRNVLALDAPPWLGGELNQLTLAADSYQLLAPCAPSKIVAVGKNYPDHAAEMGGQVPAEPLLFLKPPTAIIAHETAILYPPQSQQVDYEGELALVIGESCVNCSVEQARNKIWGYTIANDVTARDFQRKDPQWTRAKGFDTFCPLGPWLIQELPAEAQIQTFINGSKTPVQSASTADMVFAPDFLVAYISQIMTLVPGDIILTGTPAGVGSLKIGDQVSITIEGIGTLANPVEARVIPATSMDD